MAAERRQIKKNSTTAKDTKKTVKVKKQSPVAHELWAIVAIAVGIITSLCLYTKASDSYIGGVIKNTLLGLLGVPSYVLPLVIIAFGFHYLIKKDFTPYRKIYFLLLGLMTCISSAWHLFTADADLHEWGFFEYIDAAIYDYSGGGIMGGLISVTLEKLAGKAIAFTVIAVLFIIMVIILTGFSLTDFIENIKLKMKEEKKEPAKVKKTEAPALKEVHLVKKQEEPVREEPFNFDDIKIFTHDQLSLGDEKPAQASKPEDSTAESKPVPKAEPAAPISEIEAEITQPRPQLEYRFPPADILEQHTSSSPEKPEDLRESAKKLVGTLKSFGVDAKVLEVTRGPSVTRFELQPSTGVKVSRIVNLADDIALNLAAYSVRIEAPIPGKAAIGIEIPNANISLISLREVIEASEFKKFQSKTAFALGKDISGKTIVADISKMPHLLIAGATGSGKSVCLNTLISSIIFKASPDDVKLLMIDPKVVELGVYNGIPHLLIPVVTEPRKAAGALNWGVTEMLRRYKLFAECNVRDIKGYNEYSKTEDLKPLEKIIVIIDELADLMMAAPRDVEDAICRLAQMGRAAGMHLVIATQRPSVDVITGLIKANIPSRIAFAVSSHIDSRTILDMMGAEKLLGRGDMLYLPFGASKPIRLQGAFVSDKEVEHIVDFIKNDFEAEYDTSIIDRIENDEKPEKDDNDNEDDELLPQAMEIVVECGQASASLLQRKLKVGYSRAGRMVDQLEMKGIIGPHEGSKPRQVLISKQQFYEMTLQQGS